MGRGRRDRSYLRGNFSQLAYVHNSFKPSYPAQPHNSYLNRNSSPNASSAALILNNLIFSALEPSTLFILDNDLWCYALRAWHVPGFNLISLKKSYFPPWQCSLPFLLDPSATSLVSQVGASTLLPSDLRGSGLKSGSGTWGRIFLTLLSGTPSNQLGDAGFWIKNVHHWGKSI